MGRRVPFLQSNEAARASTILAVAGTNQATDLRVLLAVHSLTAHWSQLEDRCSLGQIAQAAGFDIDPDPVRQHTHIERRVARSLTRLAELGAITYTPSRGRGHLSTIGIPTPKGDSTVSYKDAEKETLSDTKGDCGVPETPEKETPQSPPQGRTPSSSPRRGGRKRRPPIDTAAWAAAKGGLTKL